MAAPEVSHGRGGAGNINPDSTKYVDGEITRTGVEGTHEDGAYSTGRGGAANIADASAKPVERKDLDIIPPAAVRPSQEDRDFHTGRGGAGNEHLVDHKDKTKAPRGLADKLKEKFFNVFKK